MKRDPRRLADKPYEVLIVGGGIQGAFCVWDAALRGLRVALVEKADFGHATSFNSLRVIHGGLRYLQHRDLGRMRRSIRERTAYMTIAPHLVRPLPFIIPTYGHGIRGKLALSAAVKVHDALGYDRNRLGDRARYLPSSRVISREECQRLLPGIEARGLTGAVIYYDCQMHNSERLLLGVLQSAAQAGAELANYIEVTELLMKGGRVSGVAAIDALSRDELEIQAGIVIDCTGPWTGDLLAASGICGNGSKPPMCKAFNVLLNRQLTADYAFGVYGRDSAEDTKPTRSRMFFILPWRDRSIVGTEHQPYDPELDSVNVADAELESFLGKVNQAYSTARIRSEDVSRVYGGLLPADRFDGPDVQLTRQFRIRDHEKDQGIEGLISVIGVKFTESRYLAERTMDLALAKLGKKGPPSATARTPIHGGEMEHLDEFMAEKGRSRQGGLSREGTDRLIREYGSAYQQVTQYLDHPSSRRAEEQRIFMAEVIHGVRDEMAQTVIDALERRTAQGLDWPPDEATARECATIMGAELGWNEARIARELHEVNAGRLAASQVG